MHKQLDLSRMLQDYNIPYAEHGHTRCSNGWINIHCPFCNPNLKKDFHLGYNIQDGNFSCWRCGPHYFWDSMEMIFKRPKSVIEPLLKRYSMTRGASKKERTQKKSSSPFQLPSNLSRMQPEHRQYLRKRGFIPSQIENTWKAVATSHSSLLGGLNYKFRILIPIYFEGQVVSFQARDITGKQHLRYMACPEEREIMHHKHILYRAPQPETNEYGICVEGVFDAWRIGPLAFATLGIKYTPEQVRMMVRTFKKIVILFDPGEDAKKQSQKLASELSFMGVEVKNIIMEGDLDPGDMPQQKADELVKYLTESFFVRRN